MVKMFILHQSRLSSDVLYVFNTSNDMLVDYHGPVHRRNGLQIPSFYKRFAGELTIICFCFVLFFLFLPVAKKIYTLYICSIFFTAIELLLIRNKILASIESTYIPICLDGFVQKDLGYACSRQSIHTKAVVLRVLFVYRYWAEKSSLYLIEAHFYIQKSSFTYYGDVKLPFVVNESHIFLKKINKNVSEKCLWPCQRF